jgi:hypothetical protein
MWKNKQKNNLREISKPIIEKYNGMERQNKGEKQEDFIRIADVNFLVKYVQNAVLELMKQYSMAFSRNVEIVRN